MTVFVIGDEDVCERINSCFGIRDRLAGFGNTAEDAADVTAWQRLRPIATSILACHPADEPVDGLGNFAVVALARLKSPQESGLCPD
jgi:hypothetical protein